MNCSSILRLALPIVGTLSFALACGPRMKPVEYEEPSKEVSSGSEIDDASSSSSSSSAASDSDSSTESAPKVAAGGSCKQKKCGDSCSECAPGDENCMEILVLKQCNLKGECVPAKAECTAKAEGKDEEKSKGK